MNATYPMCRRRFGHAGLALALWLAAAGCAPRRPDNILLITLDTTRADRLGCYGYAGALTPALDRLAAAGVRFDHALSVAPLTLPAHATLLTGLLPPEHGLRVNGENSLPPGIPTLAETLRARGYRTGAFIASFVLNHRFGLARGFDEYDDRIRPDNLAESWVYLQRDGAEVTDPERGWLEQNAAGPFFCWIHLYDPHAPYQPHPELFGARFAANPYDGDIAYMDRQIGRVLEWLRRRNLENQTLVVAVGDHGEDLFEHGERYHGLTLYDSTLRVPLIVRRPGVVAAGRVVREPVSIADLAPALRSWVGIPARDAAGLADVWRGAVPPGRLLYAETDQPWVQYGWAPLRAAMRDSWKYIRAPRAELYDRMADPRETNDLAAADPARRQALAADLAALEASLRPATAPAARLSPAEERALASLGYTGGATTSAAPASVTGLPDVKDMLELVNRLDEAAELRLAGRAAEAVTITRELVTRDPGNVAFRLGLGVALAAARRDAEALTILGAIRAAGLGSAPAAVYLDACAQIGQLHYRAGRWDEAIAALRDVVRVNPDDIGALNLLGWILAVRPDGAPAERAEALSLAARVMELDGGRSPAFLDTLAAAQAGAGAFAAAVQTLQQAIALAEHQGMSAAATEFRQRLTLYEARRPYVESRLAR